MVFQAASEERKKKKEASKAASPEADDYNYDDEEFEVGNSARYDRKVYSNYFSGPLCRSCLVFLFSWVSQCTVVVCWTAGQQVKRLILHLGHDSYQIFILFGLVVPSPE